MSDAATDFDAFEDYGNRIRWMLALLAWVENARRVLDGLDIHAQIRPRLRELLQASDVRYAISWADDESSGLQELQSMIAELTAEMARAGEALTRRPA
jgi:hypothetical protein